MKKNTLLILLFIASFSFAQTKSGKSLKTAVAISSNVANGNWSVAGSWSPAQVPTASDDVTILAGHTINVNISGAQVNNLTLNATSNMVVNAGQSITINGNATNGGVFTVNSDASGSGSAILIGALGGAGGIDRYNRYMTGGADWHLITSPLAFAKLSDFVNNNGGITTSGVQYSLGTYNNTGTVGVNLWTNFTTDSSNPPTSAAFVAGKGYELLMNSTGTVLFTGAIKTGDVSIVITPGNTRWNLVGNPYTSFMFANSNANAINFLSTNAAKLDPSFVSMYVWNPAGSSYDVINQASPAFTPSPGQAFFVKALAGGETVNFTTAMQTHSGTLFQKAQTTAIPTVKLIASNQNAKTSSTEIKYMSGTTLGLDPGFDAGRFDGVGTGFSVYTQLVQDNGVKFALQAVPDTGYDTTVITIGLDADAGTQLTIKAEITDLPVGKKVFLEDRSLGSFTEINNTDKFYTTTLSGASAGIGRFFMHTQDNSSTLAIDDFIASKYTLVALPKTNNLKLFGVVTQQGSLAIYDSLGRMIYTTSLQTGTSQDINVPTMAAGVYFVKVKVDKKSFNKKIVWY